jgi:hypothetical protein
VKRHRTQARFPRGGLGQSRMRMTDTDLTISKGILTFALWVVPPSPKCEVEAVQ